VRPFEKILHEEGLFANKHDLIRKPDSTFRDHAYRRLASGTTLCNVSMPLSRKRRTPRAACLIRCSFSTMAMRTYPSPCSPKPTPGETATPDFSTIRVANCMLPTLRKASGSGTQANIEASGGG